MMASEVSPLYRAISNHGGTDYAQTRMLLEAGHDVNEDWDVQQMERQIYSSGCVIASPTIDDCIVAVTPLFFSILHNRIQLAELLLQFGARTDIRARDGTTVLHQAVRFCNAGLVRLLCEHGADLEAAISETKNSGFTTLGIAGLHGYTPLHVAVVNNSYEMTDLLLQIGASIQATITHGWSVLDLALLNRQTMMLNFLIRKFPNTVSLREWLALLPTPYAAKVEVEDKCSIASHLISFGIEGTAQAHRQLYLSCISTVWQRLESKHALSGDELSSTLINDVERMLLLIAEHPEKIAWDRKLCDTCSKFETQDCETVLDVFLHKTTIQDLIQSADEGCGLCKMLIDALNTPTPNWCSGISEREGHLCSSQRVKLQLKKLSMSGSTLGDMELLVGCDGKVSFIKLKQTNEHFSSAVSTTGSSDTEGTHSERTLAVAKAWLERCQSCHVKCCQNASARLPTRVIDVGGRDSEVFLYYSNGEIAPYVALSYCWGGEQNLIATQATVEGYRLSIGVADLPRTIQDAITIVRKIGFRYLWVDALCIVQDSAEDFSHEVAYMDGIYSNAVFTIAVKDSASSKEGCFRNRHWASPAAFPLELRLPGGTEWKYRTSKMNRLILMPKLSLFHDQQVKKPRTFLDSRGWTLQEDLLAPRILQCWNEELRWVCLEKTYSETALDQHFSWHLHDRDMKLKPLLADAAVASVTSLNSDMAFYHWLRIVEDYSTRELSKPADKLLALDGLQRRIAFILNDTPVVGGWRHLYFWPSLLWTCEPETIKRASASFICPSWSWASVGVPVKYKFHPKSCTYIPRLESWNVIASRDQEQITGSITVKGPLLHYRQLLVQSSHTTTSVAEKAPGRFPTAYDSLTACMHVREPEKFHKDPHFLINDEEIWFLLLANVPYAPPAKHGLPVWPGGRPASVILMCLEKLSTCEMRFRRIGLAEVWDEEEWRRHGRTETIELV